jgi:IclR family acetate operon transcriptional repressor
MRSAKTEQENQGRYSVRSVLRVLDILDLLQRSPDGASLIEITELVELPKSSVFRYLATLESRGYVEQDPATGDYRFGLAFLPSHTRHLQVLGARAKPHLQELRDRFEETINLGLLDGYRIAYLEIVESPKAMRLAARKGDRDPIHSTALGKAVAARLSDADVEEILETEGMPQLTSNTITDPQVFMEELERVRRRGYALDDCENEEDGRCVAVAIPGSRVTAAISLSAPAVRFPLGDVESVADALRDTAQLLAPELGVSDG